MVLFHLCIVSFNRRREYDVIFRRIPSSWISSINIILKELYSIITDGGVNLPNPWEDVTRKSPDNCTSSSKQDKQPQALYSLGASGILSSMMMFHALSDSEAMCKLGNAVIPASQAAFMWALNDFVVLRDEDGVGHGAHLGGYLFGVIVHFLFGSLSWFFDKDSLASRNFLHVYRNCGRELDRLIMKFATSDHNQFRYVPYSKPKKFKH